MSRRVAETSKTAFESLDPTKLSEIKRKILHALSTLVEGTHEDISAFLKVDPSVIWKRLSELEKEGLIYKPGNKKALRSGRAGFTYHLADSALPQNNTEKVLNGPSISDYSRRIHSIATYVPLTLFPDR